jgi:hypothetical protein
LALAGAAPPELTKVGFGTLELTRPEVGLATVIQGRLLVHGAISGDVTIEGGALEADGHVDYLTVRSGSWPKAPVVSPGGDAIGSLSAGSLFWAGPTSFTLEMDVASTAMDYFSFSSGVIMNLQMDFRNAGGAQIGTEYAFASFTAAEGSSATLKASNFSFSAQSVQSGWSGTFRTQDGTAYVTFASVPEPQSAALLLLGGLVAARRRRRRKRYGARGIVSAGR